MNLVDDALRIFAAALKAADPKAAIFRNLQVEGETLIAGKQRYQLKQNVVVVGAGKASVAMATAVEELLGDHVCSGWINTKYGHELPLKHIHVHQCDHPVPDEAGVEGAREIGNLVAATRPDQLVICLISGGASALLPLPAQPISLAMKQETTRLLLSCGAAIQEINAVRKHLSSIKGGWLAALAYPAPVLSLILSDVIGDHLDVIGSGLTAPDSSTFADALQIFEKYDLLERVPGPVLERMQEGKEGAIPETPKADHHAFASTQNLIIGSNQLALDAAAAEAESMGYSSTILSSFIEGEAREVAKVHSSIAKQLARRGQPVAPPACLVSGGETTVTIEGNGLGGRNQEFALAAAIEIAGLEDVLLLSGGTDGTDGPTDAAGAWCDGTTFSNGPDASDYLSRNDSYNYFAKYGGLVKTGPTNTNVMDIQLILVGPTKA
jgi:glycerate 2-kinase